jgi:N-acetylmuramoyl-L-alanine amidase
LKSQVSNIKLITDAYSSESISIYAWDWVDSTWDDVGADVASSETLQTITICSGDCGRYIEDGTGNIKIKYEDDDDYDESQEKLYIDYQYLNITYGAAMSEVTVDTTAPELSADEHEDPTSDSTPTLTGSASEERTYLDEGWYTNETKSATQTNIFFGANDGTFGKFDDCYDSPSVTTSVTYSGEVMKVLDVDGRQIHAGNDNENSNTCISYPWQDVEFAVEDYPIFKFAGRFPEGTTTCLFFYMADTQAATPTWYVVGCTPDGDQGTYTSAPNKLTLIDDDKWHVYEYDLRQIGKAYMDTFEFWDNSGAGSHYYYFDNFIFQSDPWDNIDSTDGAWDEQSESISYTTPTLPDGENTLCLRTRDKAGNIGYVVENAEDGDTIGWDVYDDTPSGATITNVYDATKGSRVIKLEGPGGIENGYRRRNEDLSEWGWTKSKLIQWSMNFSEDYRIFIQTYVKNATVSDYWLFLWYNASDTSGLVYSNPGRYCHHGLGSDTKNGNWYTIIRDLEEDLRDCQPDKELVRIRAIWIRGNGSVDDIMLLSGDCDELTIDTSPPTTTIDSPAASSCQASDFTVAITDSDASPSSGWKGKVDFNDYTISSYGGQDDNSTQWEILDGGKTLHLWGSNWKKIEGPFTIDSDTILKIRFKSTQQGEINGIILDDDNTYPSNGWDGGYLWQFYGTQTFGNQTYNDYSGSDWKTYRIKPSFFGVTGTFQYIVFVNDDDANYASDVYYQLELIGIPARKACSYQVRAYNSSSDTWEVTQDWANRDCPGGDVTLTVGSSGLCKYEGSDACEILVRAEDNAGNIFSTSRKFGADWNIPSTSDDAPSAWQSANVTVTLSPSDSGCGVSNTYYCIDSDLPDCSPTTSGTTVNINCSTQCSSTIRYYSVDQVGNSESTKTSAEIRIDRLKPNATITSPSDGDWVKGTISIKANASDEALKDFKICVDPGHGGSASGATGWDGITLEKDLNLDIALMLRDILEDLGATVIMTRESDVDVSTCSPCTRCQICNDNDTDIFVSIHHNAFDGTVWGTETWYYTGSAKGSSLASKVQDELVSHLGRKDRGTKTSNTLCVLSGTSMPAIIAEIVFMDNESDFNFINQTQNKQEAAKAIAHGILSYFNRTAEDNGGIQWVRMKVDAGAWQYDNSSPHEWSLDTNSISDGAHTIYIEADDSLNNVGTDSIQINVDNTKPVMGQIYMKDEVERNTTQNITVAITDISLLAVASSKVNISIEDYEGGQNQTMSCTNIGGNDYNCSFEYIPTKTNKTVNFTIYARDSVSKTNQTTSSYMVYILRSINLSSGWNLVSLPVDEWETITTEELAQDLGMASMEVIVGQNRTTKKYDINYVVPWSIDDDEPILPGYGYWIGTNAAAGLHWRKGGNYTSITNQLKAGLNLIGSLRDMTAAELCADVNSSSPGNAQSVSRYNPSWDNYTTHICGTPDDNFAIFKGVGYWVRVENDVSWNQSGDW